MSQIEIASRPTAASPSRNALDNATRINPAKATTSNVRSPMRSGSRPATGTRPMETAGVRGNPGADRIAAKSRMMKLSFAALWAAAGSCR